MNWWHKLAEIENFEDRNRVNHAIHWLDDSIATINYLSELVYMTNRGAKKMASELVNNRTMSSYPLVVELLEQANEVALDSPKKFADLCREAAQRMQNIKEELIEQRERFGNKENHYQKGWNDE